MEKGHAGNYTGNNGKLIHKHYMENAVHDFETGHDVAGKYEAGRASAFKNSKAYLTGQVNAMSGLKQSQSQMDTFGENGTNPNEAIISAIIEKDQGSAAKMDDQFLSPVDGLDQNLANSQEAKFDSSLMQEDGYGMSAAKMSALKGRYMHHKK